MSEENSAVTPPPAWADEMASGYLMSSRRDNGRLAHLLASVDAKGYERGVRNAAAKCDEISGDKWNLYKGCHPYKGTEEGRGSSYVEGESDGADLCSDAILSLLQTPPSDGA